jgi:hypothetical protein
MDTVDRLAAIEDMDQPARPTASLVRSTVSVDLITTALSAVDLSL